MRLFTKAEACKRLRVKKVILKVWPRHYLDNRTEITYVWKSPTGAIAYPSKEYNPNIEKETNYGAV